MSKIINSKMIIRNFLSSNNTRTYNLPLCKAISLEASILYSNLIYLDELFIDNRIDDYFYTTYALIYENTGLTEDRARTALLKLKDKNLIDVVKKGLPSKNYFKINYDLDLLNEILEPKSDGNTVLKEPEKPRTTTRKNREQQHGKTESSNKDTIIYSNTITSNNKTSNKLTSSTQTSLIDIPKDTVVKSTIVEDVIDYLNVIVGRRYSAKSSENIKLIEVLSRKYSLDDFKYVIDVKFQEWGNNNDMKQYLQPSTLFRASKFERYLQQPMKTEIVMGIDMVKNREIKSNKNSKDIDEGDAF